MSEVHHTGIQGLDTYVDQIRNEEIEVCGYVKKAVERHVNDMKRSAEDDPDFPYYFEQKAAIHFFDFAFMECKHFEGQFAGEPVELLPWQQFVFGSLFGWLHKEKKRRRFRETHIEIPKKNGKSLLGAVIGLYGLLWDNEPGAQVYNLATNRTHAMKLSYNAAQKMVEASDMLSKKFFINKSIATMRIACPENNSYFEPLTSKPQNLDGFNVHMSINDETKDWTDKSVYNLIYDGTAARREPLIFNITTAGHDQDSLGYEHRQMGIDVLQGSVVNESYFTIIYTIDDGDEKYWDEERIWKKANPSYGVTVDAEYFQNKAIKANKKDHERADFYVKHLNLWVAAMKQWMDMNAWGDCRDESLDLMDYVNQPGYITLDLASNNDLCSLNLLIKNEEEYLLFSKNYMPTEAVQNEKHGRRLQYLAWEKSGKLTITPGQTTDYSYIEADIRSLLDSHNIQAVGFDPYQSNYMINNLSNDGVKVIKVPNTVKTLSQPMKNLEKFVLDKSLRHNNPVLTWCMGNVVAKEDRKANIFPNKEDRGSKIDSAVAAIMGFALELHDPLQTLTITGTTYDLT